MPRVKVDRATRNILSVMAISWTDFQASGTARVSAQNSKTECIVHDQDIAIDAAFFFDYIQTCDPEIHAALPHTDDNIAGTLKDDA